VVEPLAQAYLLLSLAWTLSEVALDPIVLGILALWQSSKIFLIAKITSQNEVIEETLASSVRFIYIKKYKIILHIV